jgi:hypothetical protein
MRLAKEIFLLLKFGLSYNSLPVCFEITANIAWNNLASVKDKIMKPSSETYFGYPVWYLTLNLLVK